jgi:hypothetical protein
MSRPIQAPSTSVSDSTLKMRFSLKLIENISSDALDGKPPPFGLSRLQVTDHLRPRSSDAVDGEFTASETARTAH